MEALRCAATWNGAASRDWYGRPPRATATARRSSRAVPALVRRLRRACGTGRGREHGRGRRTRRPVAVRAPNTLDWIVSALGAVSAGAVLVPLNTRFKGAEAAYVLDRSRARLLFVTGTFLGTSYVASLRRAAARARRGPSARPPAPGPGGRALRRRPRRLPYLEGLPDRRRTGGAAAARAREAALRAARPPTSSSPRHDGPPQGRRDHPRPDPAPATRSGANSRACARATAT